MEVWDTVKDVDESFDRMTALGKLHLDFVQSQVWRVDGNVKSDVPLVDVGKFYDNSCYIVLYTYQGDKSDRKEEYLLCYWLGQQASLVLAVWNILNRHFNVKTCRFASCSS